MEDLSDDSCADSAEFPGKEISKSEKKRQLKELKALVIALSELSDGQYQQLPLDDQVKRALDELRRTRSHVAKKRQTQYATKCLSNCSRLEEVQTVYAQISGQKAKLDAEFHQAEQWRTKLLDDPKSSLTAFLSEYPLADSQTVRHKVAKARQEREKQQNLGAYKALFRYIREIIDASPDI